MQQSMSVTCWVLQYIWQWKCTYVDACRKERIEIMRVMFVTWLKHVLLSISAWQKPYISDKCSKMRVLRFPESRPSVKICFGFWGSFGLELTKKLYSRRMERMKIACYKPLLLKNYSARKRSEFLTFTLNRSQSASIFTIKSSLSHQYYVVSKYIRTNSLFAERHTKMNR